MKLARKILVLAAVPLLACALSMEARAEQVTVLFKAQVTGIEDFWSVIAGRIKVGDMIDGTYVYDTGTPDANPLPTSGLYVPQATHHGLSVLVNDFLFTSNPANLVFTVETRDVAFDFPSDLLQLRSTKNLFQLTVPGETYNSIGLFLKDDLGAALQSDALPNAAPVLSQWTSAQVFLSSASAESKFNIDAEVIEIVDCRSTGTNGRACD